MQAVADLVEGVSYAVLGAVLGEVVHALDHLHKYDKFGTNLQVRLDLKYGTDQKYGTRMATVWQSVTHARH